MSHDPLRGAFERLAPPQVSPAEARDRLGALTPGFRTARRNHRIRTGIAGVTAAVALAVGGPVAIAAIAPGSPTPAVDFASPDAGTGIEVVEDESIDTETSSSAEDAPDGATDTLAPSAETSGDGEATGHESGALGQDRESDDDPVGHDAGDDDDDSSDESDSSHSDDDEDDDSDSNDDDEESPAHSEAYVEGVTYPHALEGVGTLSVRVIDGALQLVEATAEGDLEVEVRERDDEIRATFSSESTDERRIEVELEDGELRWKTE